MAIGPFEVAEVVNHGAIRLQLPHAYVSTHDVFSVHDSRTLFRARERYTALDYPNLVVPPSLNQVIHVLDCKRFGHMPHKVEPLDIRACDVFVRVALMSGCHTTIIVRTATGSL